MGKPNINVNVTGKTYIYHKSPNGAETGIVCDDPVNLGRMAQIFPHIGQLSAQYSQPNQYALPPAGISQHQRTLPPSLGDPTYIQDVSNHHPAIETTYRQSTAIDFLKDKWKPFIVQTGIWVLVVIGSLEIGGIATRGTKPGEMTQSAWKNLIVKPLKLDKPKPSPSPTKNDPEKK